jgi:hypothetical protein
VSTNMYTSDIASIRLRRIVYARWNQVTVRAVSKDGSTLVRWVMEDGKFGPDHKPTPITWEHPDFPEKKEEYAAMNTPREVFNQKQANQPEDWRIVAIKETLLSYDDESEDPKTILKAIHEILWGPVSEPTPVEGPVEVQDEEAR